MNVPFAIQRVTRNGGPVRQNLRRDVSASVLKVHAAIFHVAAVRALSLPLQQERSLVFLLAELKYVAPP